ncbi:ATP-binding protein [Marinospirillum sp.]|uniref:ATP-binding protein n=1 Tax=Marinospirillum sp. TaxID=2183934 RepID=UPI00384D99A7
MGQLEQTRARCKSLRLTWMAQQLPQLLGEAESNDWSYLQCIDHLMGYELKERDQKRIQRLRKPLKVATHSISKLPPGPRQSCHPR